MPKRVVSLKRMLEVMVVVLSICLAKLVFLPYVPRQSWFHRCSKMQDRGTKRVNEETKQTNRYCCQKNLTLGTRGFSRVRREFSVLAEGRHIFGRRPKPREKSLAPRVEESHWSVKLTSQLERQQICVSFEFFSLFRSRRQKMSLVWLPFRFE